MPFHRHEKALFIANEPCDATGAVWGRMWFDGREYDAEVRMPPEHRDVAAGECLTFHRTKAGHGYIFRINQPFWSKRKIKKARIEANALAKALGIPRTCPDAPTVDITDSPESPNYPQGGA